MKKFYVTLHILQPVTELWAFDVPDETDIKDFKRLFNRDHNSVFCAYPKFEFIQEIIDDRDEGEFSHLGDVSLTPPNTEGNT
jgi:hypothetical protein